MLYLELLLSEIANNIVVNFEPYVEIIILLFFKVSPDRSVETKINTNEKTKLRDTSKLQWIEWAQHGKILDGQAYVSNKWTRKWNGIIYYKFTILDKHIIIR